MKIYARGVDADNANEDIATSKHVELFHTGNPPEISEIPGLGEALEGASASNYLEMVSPNIPVTGIGGSYPVYNGDTIYTITPDYQMREADTMDFVAPLLQFWYTGDIDDESNLAIDIYDQVGLLFAVQPNYNNGGNQRYHYATRSTGVVTLPREPVYPLRFVLNTTGSNYPGQPYEFMNPAEYPNSAITTGMFYINRPLINVDSHW